MLLAILYACITWLVHWFRYSCNTIPYLRNAVHTNSSKINNTFNKLLVIVVTSLHSKTHEFILFAH